MKILHSTKTFLNISLYYSNITLHEMFNSDNIRLYVLNCDRITQYMIGIIMTIVLLICRNISRIYIIYAMSTFSQIGTYVLPY